MIEEKRTEHLKTVGQYQFNIYVIGIPEMREKERKQSKGII